MKVTNCIQCGKVFKQVRSKMCPACQEAHDDFLHDMFNFIKDNPGVNIKTLATKYKRDAKEIENLIAESENNRAKQTVKIDCVGCQKEIFLFECEHYQCAECAQAKKDDADMGQRMAKLKPKIQQELVETVRESQKDKGEGLHNNRRRRQWV